MVTLDRIRLTGLLRKSPGNGAFSTGSCCSDSSGFRSGSRSAVSFDPLGAAPGLCPAARLSAAVSGGEAPAAKETQEGAPARDQAGRRSRAGRRPVAPLAYTREQAAQALGVSLATLDRRVVPAIATVKTEWGALIPVGELERYLVERREEPRVQWRPAALSGRKSALPPEVIARIRREHAPDASLGEIARRLKRDDIPTGRGGRQWWPTTVRAVVLRQGPSGSARTVDR
jgi:hypothetical protein